MNDDLGDRPLDLDTGNQGQPGTSEVVQTEQFVRRSDLQALQSKYDSQMEQTRRDARQQVAEAKIVLAQANAVIEQAKIDNPDSLPGLIAAAKAASLEAENAVLKSEQQERLEYEQQQEAAEQKYLQDLEDARAWYTAKAPKYGVDPNDKEFQSALLKTLTDGDEMHVMEVLMRSKFGQGQAATEPQTVPVLPPAGGGPPHALSAEQEEQLSGQLLELMNEPTKNASQIAAIKSRLGL